MDLYFITHLLAAELYTQELWVLQLPHQKREQYESYYPQLFFKMKLVRLL